MKKTLYILAALLLCCAGFTGCSDDDDSTTAGMSRLKLISVIPKAASSGETAIISGNGFATDPAQNEVTINGKKAEVVSATADRLVITLPDNPDGTYAVTVKTGGKEVEGLHITYAPGRVKELAVLQCMPSYAYAGEQIKIIGQCFSEVAAENKVSINGAEAQVTEATSTMLTIVVPDTQEGTYPVKVTVGDKTASGSSFTYAHVVRLTTATIEPASGKPGTEILLTGEGFGKTPADNHVTINGKEAEVKSVTPTELTIIAPENPEGSYPVVVTVDGVTVDNQVFKYVSDPLFVKTIAGSGAAATTDGTGTAAAIRSPQGIALASDGALWICQQNGNALRRMTIPGYDVTTVTVSQALSAPWCCAFGPDGNLVLANKANHTVYKVAADGTARQILTAADWKGPMGVAFDKAGNLYIADRDAKLIRKISPSGEKLKDFSMSDCKQGPCAVTVDAKGNIYAVNGGDYKVFMFDAEGARSVLFGDGVKPTAATWSDGEPGNPSSATMGQSFGITIGSDGKIYLTDLLAFVVRTITPDANGDFTKGTVKTIAGIPFTKGKADGQSESATFAALGTAVEKDGLIYVADNGNNLIRLISKQQ